MSGKMRFSNRFIMVIDFDVLLYPAQFISEAKYNTNASALVDLDMVHQFDQNIPRQLVDILILPERQQKRVFYINTISAFSAWRRSMTAPRASACRS